MTTAQYLENINKRYQLGNSTEHTFRGDLQQILESLVPDISATNEPRRQKCGAPDFIIIRNDIPIGYIEAKDIANNDLEGKRKTVNKEQFDRYKASLNNIIFTDYLNFHFYRENELLAVVSIAELKNNKIVAKSENFALFETHIKSFCTHISQSIVNSKKLAEMMALKAKLLAEIIEKAILSDIEQNIESDLIAQMTAFKQVLIHDISPKSFADVYSQTIAYGLFAARYHDPTLPTFSREEAATLIPKSNPFLRKLFAYIAGPDLDDRIKWVVDSLIDIFLATDVATILSTFGKSTKTEDPIIHFYENFLSQYDPKLRKSRGVWYTPQPVVQFIVRAVDDILKSEFGLSQGLADTSKTKIKVDVQGKKVEQEVHKVQILDPATGTGTFLAEVVRHIHKKFAGQQGIWSKYVEDHLLPRLNGFELLMASYAMAHLKLDLLLSETGYKATSNQRMRIYLTNSLEESHPDTGTLFANWLSTEANEANHIKRDSPVMCIIGNPPYSGESANKGDWIMNLMEDYKKEPGGQIKLKERNPKWINDDYVKFIRYGQYFIEKNGSGILAFINPHGYLDNPTFRGMRWNLLKTYDKIYTIDLHGNTNKKETSPDGSPDVNVFDIMQGVSINIFVKTGKKKSNELGKVYHKEIYGLRELKYDFLNNNSIFNILYDELILKSPNYFFKNMNLSNNKIYEKGIDLNNLFLKISTGYYTSRDEVVIANHRDELESQILNYYKNKFNFQSSLIKKTTYRPFDNKLIYFDQKLITRSRSKFIGNFIGKENYILLLGKGTKAKKINHFYITKFFSELKCAEYTTGSYMFPLYTYLENINQMKIENDLLRRPNLNLEIVKQIAEKLELTFTNEKETRKNTFAPIDILDYIYAVLHSPKYREKYKEFLKIDFPKVPYPKDQKTFWKLVKLGGEIRQIHLLESDTVEKYITQYPCDGTNLLEKVKYDNGRVYINDTQYFDKVPEIAWNFYIGGYQPAQKWLKDRKGRVLDFEDILHYQKIIVALSETHRLMLEIDKIEIE